MKLPWPDESSVIVEKEVNSHSTLSSMRRCLPTVAVLIACVCCLIQQSAHGQTDVGRTSLRDTSREAISGQRANLTERYATGLADLAARCDDERLAEAAKFVRGWLPKRDPLKLYIFKLPESLEVPEAFTASEAQRRRGSHSSS